jgi:hypothetical protein
MDNLARFHQYFQIAAKFKPFEPEYKIKQEEDKRQSNTNYQSGR